jgi:hypothetical protein
MPKTAAKKSTKSARKLATPSLRAASLPRRELVDVGARFSLKALTNHASAVLAKVTAQNADDEATERFRDYGFGPEWVSAIEGLVASVDDAGETANAVAGSALPTAQALASALSTAKELRRQAVTVIAADPTRTSAIGVLGSGSSVPATRRGLVKVTALVPAGAVTPSGTGKEWRAKAQAALKALDAAEKAHRAALGKLSPAAVKVHATKGVLYKELKSAARVARTVTPSDSHLFALSSHVHVHDRSRKHAKSGAAAKAAATGAGSTATTGAAPKA